MSHWLRFMGPLLLGTMAGLSAHAEACTEAGVRDTETKWGQAFQTGDEAYLNALLDDDYVSVNAKGVARPKAAIIALAKKMAAGPKAAPTAPPQEKISLHGAAAIVTFSTPTDVSVDVFHCEDGVWRAWYSQHTTVSKP